MSATTERDDTTGDYASTFAVTGAAILAVVAVIGAVMSYANLQKAAALYVGDRLSLGFPALVDALILGATLRAVAHARRGQRTGAYRATAHAAIAATIALNAAAATTLAGIPWHVAAPCAWAVLVELFARDATGEYRAKAGEQRDRIPARLWLSTPVTAGRAWLHMARTGAPTYVGALADISVIHATIEGTRMGSTSGTHGDVRRLRRAARRYLRAGIVTPDTLLAILQAHEDARAAWGALVTEIAAHSARTPRARTKPAQRPAAAPAHTDPARSDVPAARTETPPRAQDTPAAADSGTTRVTEAAWDACYAEYAARRLATGREMTGEEIVAFIGQGHPGNARNRRNHDFRTRYAATTATDDSDEGARTPMTLTAV